MKAPIQAQPSTSVTQDSRLYGVVFFALAVTNGILGYLDSSAHLTTEWDELTFPVIMTIYFAASITVIIWPRWLEAAFVSALLPTTIYQVGIVYLAIHAPTEASYYSAASGTSFFPQVYVGLFIVSPRRATLFSTLHCSAFFLLAAFNWFMLTPLPGSPLRIPAEHLLNAILLSHPTYILALRYIVRLRERLSQAQEAIHQEKSNFLSMLSHEIRNLLQTMVNAIDLLDLQIKESKGRRALARLQGATGQLQTYLADVGELTKLENPTLRLTQEKISLSLLLEEIREEWSIRAEEKGLALALHPATAADLFITTDPARLRQIVTNLVSNALKYTALGSVSLSAEKTGEGFLIKVSDTGVGIDPKYHTRIFEPHVRLDSELSSSTNGSGLGLAIVDKLVRSLDGRIELQSRPGEGSTFSVFLPAKE